MTIRLTDEVGAICVDPDDGRRVHALLADGLSRGEVVIDFAGVTRVTSSFLNPAIGRLYGSFSADHLEHSLRFVGLSEEDRAILDLVIRNARQYYGASETEQTALETIETGR